MRKAEAEALWKQAEAKAQADLQRLKDRGLWNSRDDDADRAEEAMLKVLEVLHSPMNQALKAKAARIVLEWTKPKPTKKSKVTTNGSMAWFDEIEAELNKT